MAGRARRSTRLGSARHQLVFVGRLVATLIHLRHDLPHSVLGLVLRVDRSTITPAVAEIRTLPTQRGARSPTVPACDYGLWPTCSPTPRPKVSSCDWTPPRSWSVGPSRPRWTARIRFREEETERHEGRRRRWPAGPHVVGRRPAAWSYARCHGRPQRGRGRLLPALPRRRSPPGRRLPRPEPPPPWPSTPPRKPRAGALPGGVQRRERDRHEHSSDRITVEHALADHKPWRQLTRWTRRSNRLPEAHRAIANLVSDRTAT